MPDWSIRYIIRETWDGRCNSAMTSLFRSNHSDLQNTSSRKKKNKQEKRVQQPRGPYRQLRQPKESLFVEQAILKGKRGEKATAMKTLKRGWDYIVTFRVIFSYNVSYTSGPKVPCVISLKYVKYCWANFPVWGVQVKPGFPVCCHIQDARNVCGRHPYLPL